MSDSGATVLGPGDVGTKESMLKLANAFMLSEGFEALEICAPQP